MESLFQAFANAFTLEVILILFAGVILGIMFGATPGISTSMGMALMLPITYKLTIFPSMALLLGLYIGGVSGGLITAILLNIPGTPGSIATTFDGHPMARRGEAGKALGIGILYSFFGGLISLLLLFTLAPVLAGIALKFTAVEYFSITLFSFVLIAGLSGKSLVKGLISAILGVIFTTVGVAPIDAMFRYTFGFHALDGGIQLLPVLIGVYAMTEILKVAEFDTPLIQVLNYKMKGFGVSLKMFKEQFVNLVRSSIIGAGIGLLPGLGANISNILAYSAAKKYSKHPEKFGTGIVDGLVASESSNNSVSGGAMIPLLTMGIPGDAGTAILLGGLTIHGIQAGPLLFIKQEPLIYTIFLFLIMANFMMLFAEYFGMKCFLKMIKIPKYYLFPIIIVICCVGAFSTNNRIFDVWMILFFSLVSFFLYKFKFPSAPFVLGFVLGGMFETNLCRGITNLQSNPLNLINYPIALVMLALTLIVIIYTVFSRLKKSEKYDKDTQ